MKNYKNPLGKLALCISIMLFKISFISAQYNTNLGYKAGDAVSTGHKNVMVGERAGATNNGSGNIFIGSYAGKNETGSNKLIISNDTLKNTIYGDLSKRRVAIATNLFPTDTMYRLIIEGKVIAREYKATQTMPWPDYVFNDEYKLLSLVDLDKYIKKNNHLPDIPSSAEVDSTGIELASINTVLLKKIEELTIYLINQNKAIDSMKNEMTKMNALLITNGMQSHEKTNRN